MLRHEGPSTSSAPYGTMEIEKKKSKNYNQVGFTIFKAVETISSLYCTLLLFKYDPYYYALRPKEALHTYFIYEFFMHEDTLSIVYISWPVFSILDVVVILDRLFNFQREANVLVFEIATCFLGYITHTLCAVVLMYLLNQERPVHYDQQGTVLDPKFLRYIKPAVTSTTIACIYLMDCLLSADALLNIWGIQTWSRPDEPNLQVDLEPSEPLKFVPPWETSLTRDSVIMKIRQLSKSKKNSADINKRSDDIMRGSDDSKTKRSQEDRRSVKGSR